ncbi:MAG: hypothetical protein KA715_10915 [Xanthomonadaceae bacterium]|nr:hypothetical protein [Xanthomonadaceae bacterium]
MTNPNSATNRIKRSFFDRWSSEDYPGAEPRFQVGLFTKDIAIFILFPIVVLTVARSCDLASSSPRRSNTSQQQRRDLRGDINKSQIINFGSKGSDGLSRPGTHSGYLKKAPGTLVKLKLMNVVETYATAPVHAQIINAGLGNSLMGGTLIGDASPDPAFERITINFRYAKDPNRDGVALSISARALSPDGTLGLDATKKEGFFARSVYNSASGASQEARSKMGSSVDFKDVLFRALTAGLVQEFGSGTETEKIDHKY